MDPISERLQEIFANGTQKQHLVIGSFRPLKANVTISSVTYFSTNTNTLIHRYITGTYNATYNPYSCH